jgi:hypothetical protein
MKRTTWPNTPEWCARLPAHQDALRRRPVPRRSLGDPRAGSTLTFLTLLSLPPRLHNASGTRIEVLSRVTESSHHPWPVVLAEQMDRPHLQPSSSYAVQADRVLPDFRKRRFPAREAPEERHGRCGGPIEPPVAGALPACGGRIP